MLQLLAHYYPNLMFHGFQGKHQENCSYDLNNLTVLNVKYTSVKLNFFFKDLLLTSSLWRFGDTASLHGDPRIPTRTPSMAKLLPEDTDHRGHCKAQTRL